MFTIQVKNKLLRLAAQPRLLLLGLVLAGLAPARAEEAGPFTPESGTWVNWLARLIFRMGPVQKETDPTTGIEHLTHIQYDFMVLAFLGMAVLGLMFALAARKLKLRPEGSPATLTNLVEAAIEGYRNYLLGIMGDEMGARYAPLISSFFFTILVFNWMGMIPGLLSPTANPNITFALGIVAFFCVHTIAIKEVGVKAYVMHFVGEPLFLAPLNICLHVIGELVKPMALSIRLLCNVFGEEMVIAQLALLSIAVTTALHLPPVLPFQLPMMLLGLFFGFLQALVFSTLLAIYIMTMGTHEEGHAGHEPSGAPHGEHTAPPAAAVVQAH